MKTRFILISTLFLIITTLTASALPVISNISPNNAATDVVLDAGKVYLRANITDATGLNYVAFETNKTGNWTKLIGISLLGSNWTTSSPISFTGLKSSTKYYWRIRAQNSSGNWTNSSVFSFTTSVASTGSKDITIVPSQPKAKKSVIFIAGEEDASGYVMCYETGDVYFLEIKKGVGIVDLGIEYGSAIAYIIGYGSKTFTIQSPYSGELQINAPSDAEIDKSVDITVTAQGETVQANLNMVSPTGRKISRITGSTPTEIVFDETGTWTITAKIYNTTETATILISPKPLQIDAPDEIRLNDEGTITTSPGATVTIEKGEVSWTYTADDNGDVFFTPEWTGRYKVTAEASNQQGIAYFNVVTTTTISIKNEKGETVNQIAKGDNLFIQILDSNGQIVAGTNELKIYGDLVELVTLPVVGGSTLWHVTTSAISYDFEFNSNDALYLPATLSLTGSSSQGGVDALYLYIGAVILIVVVILLLLHWRGIIDLRSILSKKEEDPLL